MSKRAIEAEWRALKEIESSFRTHPVERALLSLGHMAERIGDTFIYLGRKCSPREIVALANRQGANIYYPIIAPHPKALIGGPSWKLTYL